ncbi:2-amino-4-hydroxy-6-hydroxymethyldihydropteridine diphosphokinase [Agrobacterium vitis]|uniref:2-amino-4-hydroxy-6-hydroxymethyldihydropteridine pyrophosphokinase n=1 Tax=Agrobacterium vitis TaxID=373 RepID=A0A6L6VAN9_AGRVI|nr:2-amino-4-hydroxy-6-hydroxymethyldihydropteridine diphosphokinase [Agrobacterium vitis]
MIAALGLGGNIGDPAHAMAVALKALDERPDCMVLAVSRLYRTPPWGKLDQADFFNSCALVRTTLPPSALLSVCLELERVMKRERRERWGPRTLDIDILLYGDQSIEEDHLSIPHPRMVQRAFVLQPLCDIGSDLVVEGRSVADWLGQADAHDIVVADTDLLWWKRT